MLFLELPVVFIHCLCWNWKKWINSVSFREWIFVCEMRAGVMKFVCFSEYRIFLNSYSGCVCYTRASLYWEEKFISRKNALNHTFYFDCLCLWLCDIPSWYILLFLYKFGLLHSSMHSDSRQLFDQSLNFRFVTRKTVLVQRPNVWKFVDICWF